MLIKISDRERLDIPHEPGEWMLLRRLSWTQLASARQAQEAAGLAQLRDLGAELLTTLGGLADGDGRAREVYHRATLLELGIGGWSYDMEPTPETIAMLDQATADWAYAALVALNEAGGAAGRGEASGVSINGSTASAG